MDEVKIVRHRTHIWPVIVAVILLAVVIGYVFFARRGPVKQQLGWNNDVGIVQVTPGLKAPAHFTDPPEGEPQI
jgi:hypothetical protein